MPGLGDFLGNIFRPQQVQQPGQAFADPMANMGPMDRLGYMRQNNPTALMGLAAGLMQGDMGKGFALAGDQMQQHRDQLMEQQERGQKENMTKRWLMANKGMSEEDAAVALSNPAILAQALKAPEEPKAPQIVELFDEATGQPYKATWNPQTGGYERVGGVKARSGMSLRTNADGSVELVQGDLSGNLPKLTEAEGRNSGFYGRGVKSHQVLSTLEQEGKSLWNQTAGQIPVVGNYMRSENAQKYDQAQRDFINAVLRRESGAVISPEEFSNAKVQYFPQPGDGPEVIAQKRANRETTIRGLEISAGQGASFATQPPTEGASDGWTIVSPGVRIRRKQ